MPPDCDAIPAFKIRVFVLVASRPVGREGQVVQTSEVSAFDHALVTATRSEASICSVGDMSWYFAVVIVVIIRKEVLCFHRSIVPGWDQLLVVVLNNLQEGSLQIITTRVLSSILLLYLELQKALAM